MKRSIKTIITVVGLLFAVVAWYYLNQVWEGISVHTPPCAPIGDSTVPIVFGFTGAGAAVCLVAVITSFRRWIWTSVAALALVLNLAALSTWGYWIENRMLLPYDQFCEKAGMP